MNRVNITDAKPYENYYVTVKLYSDGVMKVIDQGGQFVGDGWLGQWLSTTPEGSFSPILVDKQQKVVVNLAMNKDGQWFAVVVEDDDG